MPRCYGCKKLVSWKELTAFGANNRDWPEYELGCSDCRSKRLTHGVSAKEVTMSSDERKPVASIQIFDNEDDNYAIQGYVRFGGIKLEIDTDVNRVRDFFTKRRERKDAKKAKKEKPHLRSME
jgi:hypothetical protein